MLLTEHPPHRSRRAQFTHRAPTLGVRRQGEYAACRTRSRPWVTLTRLCVRRMRASPEFPLVPSLRSTGSALGFLCLFVGFTATMKESDFSNSCIIGYGSSPSRCGPLQICGQAGDLPVPKQGAYMHARFSDHAGPSRYSHFRTCPCCLPLLRQRRHPGL